MIEICEEVSTQSLQEFMDRLGRGKVSQQEVLDTTPEIMDNIALDIASLARLLSDPSNRAHETELRAAIIDKALWLSRMQDQYGIANSSPESDESEPDELEED